MHRRDFLGSCWVSACLAALRPAAGRAGEPPIRGTGLGIVIYCLSLQRQALQREEQGADLFQPARFLRYCHALGAGGVQLPLGQLGPADARQLRDQAEAWGMFLEGIVSPPFSDADLDRFEHEMRTAAEAGARVVRTVILPGRRYERFTSWDEFQQFSRRGAQAVARAAPVAERLRVRLAVENHKGQRVEARLALLQQISSEFVGACVDTGNSIALLEDPLEVVRAYAPWAFSVHIKDQAVRETKDGFLLADAALGQGMLDLPAMVAALRQPRPAVHFSLETITRDPLEVPCLTDAYWSVMQDASGRDLARTLRLVREREAESLERVSQLPAAQQAALELRTVQQCLAYARDTLGL